jgi:hypothetical protein
MFTQLTEAEEANHLRKLRRLLADAFNQADYDETSSLVEDLLALAQHSHHDKTRVDVFCALDVVCGYVRPAAPTQPTYQ